MSYKHIIYVDGCCLGNGKPNARAGIGVYAEEPYPMKISEPVYGPATNNEAEIQAAIRALQEAKSYGLSRVRIRTDSHLVVMGMTEWIYEWVQNGFKRINTDKSLINAGNWRKLYNISTNFQEIIWEEVSAHSGIPGNEMADKLAKNGAKMYNP